MQQCSTSYTEMKTTIAVAIFLLIDIVWTTTSTVIRGKEELNPRDVSPVITHPTYCSRYYYSGSPSDRTLNCTVSKNENFDGIRDFLSADSYIDYYRVELHMTSALDIPADVLGGKRAKRLTLYCPDRSTPAGKMFSVDVFRSTSNFTTHVHFHNCNLTNFSFDILAQFPALKELGIYDSSLKTFNDMPSLPTLDSIEILDVTDFESWYSPSLTPNLEWVVIYGISPDLNDEKMDAILSPMTNFHRKLTHLYLDNNALTRVPPLAFSFPALISIGLNNNPIVTLETGSVNNTYDNLRLLSLVNTNLTTVEPGAFIGNFSSTQIYLGNNPTMTTFPSSSFQYLLESMVGHSGYVHIENNPISDDCGLAWLIRDNRELLRYVRGGAIANGTAFEDLNPGGCFEN